MKPFPIILVIFLFVSPVLLRADDDPHAANRAHEILNKVDDLWRGTSSHAIASMTVHTKHYTRTLKMEIWSQGKENTLVRILAPLKEKGAATLKIGNSIYTYLPKIDRTIRLTSGMMSGSWMGSHFTNDDLVKESRMDEDYDPEIAFEGEKDGKQVLEFTLIPLPDAAVVWGKLTLLAQKDPLLPLSEVYYDEDMQVARAIQFTDVKILGGQPRPATLILTPADKPDEYTRIDYEMLELNVPLKPDLFSLSNLKKHF